MAGVSQPAELRNTPVEAVPPPRWIAPWLALLAPLYVISPLALLALPQLRKLPTTAKYILAFYAVSQQLPALFSPEPLLASLLALARTLLMFGLMGVGVALGSSDRLKPFTIGLGVVLVTSLVYFISSTHDLISLRLTHPYMTSTTLGLAGAIGIWFFLFNTQMSISRILLGISSLGILLFSGSRGALVALIVSTLLTFLIENKHVQRLVISVSIMLGIALFTLGQHFEINSLQRLTNLYTTDRDIIWSDTFSVIRQAPLSGVGNYLLGRSLSPTSDACKLFPTAEGQVSTCPGWLSRLGNPWLIAHNLTLQQLAESGPLGLTGQLILISFVVANSIASKESFSIALITGLIITSTFDNTLLVPSPFFAELFWITTGIQLSNIYPLKAVDVAVSLAILIVLALPLVGIILPQRHFSASLNYLSAARQVSSPNHYTVRTRFVLPIGKYRVNLRSCTMSCATLATIPFQVGDQPSQILTIKVNLRSVKMQRLELRLFPGESTLKSVPNNIYIWNVGVQP